MKIRFMAARVWVARAGTRPADLKGVTASVETGYGPVLYRTRGDW